MRISRRTRQAVIALIGAIVLVGAMTGAAAADPLQARAAAQLSRFTTWLERGHARGYVGEVGWPGNPAAGGDLRWNDLARGWYGQVQRAGLPVTAWSAGDFWQSSYKLLLYATDTFPTLVPTPQAAVVEGLPPALRGINLAGAEFGATPVDEATSPFSNEALGTFGKDYTYPEASTLRYVAARGIRTVRLPLRWERLQPKLRAPLDPTEVGRLRAVLADAGAAGLRVILDVHNYGAYYVARDGHGVRRAIGSKAVPDAAFADLWRRLARAVRADRAVTGFGLMNEPTGMAGPRAWERASRAAVRAIRGTGERRTVYVAGYDWSSVANFARSHPRGPWLRGRGIVYEGHQYFDADNTGRYLRSYDDEVALARAEGYR